MRRAGLSAVAETLYADSTYEGFRVFKWCPYLRSKRENYPVSGLLDLENFQFSAHHGRPTQQLLGLLFYAPNYLFIYLLIYLEHKGISHFAAALF